MEEVAIVYNGVSFSGSKVTQFGTLDEIVAARNTYDEKVAAFKASETEPDELWRHEGGGTCEWL